MSHDPISDMLSMISNSIMSKSYFFVVPYSRLKLGILSVLRSYGYIQSIDSVSKGNLKFIHVSIKPSTLSFLKRASRPGRRLYVQAKRLRPVRAGYGISIISTSSGVICDSEARKMGLGGELICQVWLCNNQRLGSVNIRYQFLLE